VPKAKSPRLHQVLTRLERGKLCYGKPIEAHGRTVVPVTRVQLAGRLDDGAGNLQAQPVGFIEVAPEGARFTRIEEPNVPAGLGAGALVAGGVLAAVAVRRRGARLRIQSRPARRLVGR
jgi:uncharacterized spore protein YtfJ